MVDKELTGLLMLAVWMAGREAHRDHCSSIGCRGETFFRDDQWPFQHLPRERETQGCAWSLSVNGSVSGEPFWSGCLEVRKICPGCSMRWWTKWTSWAHCTLPAGRMYAAILTYIINCTTDVVAFCGDTAIMRSSSMATLGNAHENWSSSATNQFLIKHASAQYTMCHSQCDVNSTRCVICPHMHVCEWINLEPRPCFC